MKILKIALFLLPLLFASVQAQEIRAVDQYNLEGNVGLKGYDPVSYFPEGGVPGP